MLGKLRRSSRKPSVIYAITNKSLWAVTFALLVVMLLSCSEQPSSPKASSRQEPGPQLGKKFTIQYGRQVRLESEGLEVRFASVTSESRCPSDPEVKCVWEGYAQIAVQLDKARNDAALMKLNTPNPLQEKYSSRKSYLVYTVELVELTPYPETAEAIEHPEYAATLLITRRQRRS